jgi:hypothetical protein
MALMISRRLREELAQKLESNPDTLMPKAIAYRALGVLLAAQRVQADPVMFEAARQQLLRQLSQASPRSQQRAALVQLARALKVENAA